MIGPFYFAEIEGYCSLIRYSGNVTIIFSTLEYMYKTNCSGRVKRAPRESERKGQM